MKLGKRWEFRKVFAILYGVAFAVYIIVGLTPAEAVADYEVTAELLIPSIGLSTDVAELSLNGDELIAPDQIAGSYNETESKTLLIGHSGTVFRNLKAVKIGDEIEYNGKSYVVTVEKLAAKGAVDMTEVLAPTDKNTIIIMTCDGMMLDGNDATHRLMITAEAVQY